MAGAAYYHAVKYDFPREQAFRLSEVWRTFKDALWAFILPIAILGSIFGGIVTATEGAGMAVVAAIVVGGFIYRDLDFRELRKACVDGGIQTAVVMLLVAASALIGTFLTEAQLPQALGHAITTITDNKYVVLLLLNFAFLILGMFLHSAAAIILVIPIVMPMVQRGRHRSHPFRPGGDAQPRHRPADAAGRERADDGLRHRQSRYLGNHERQHPLSWRRCCSCCCSAPTCRPCRCCWSILFYGG